ncbi:MAG: class I SAM-dependent methyltransferase, partial [archaeon]|nr:class I SAM-dependent methyltransferase [archaeon]
MDRWVDFQQRRIVKKITFSGKSLLDMGCGSGDYLKIFAESLGKENLAGLDIFKAEIPGIKTFKGTGEKLLFDSNSFDVVFEKDTLHHIEDKKKAISEMKRVARKQVVLVEANLNNRVMDAFIDKKVHHH